MAPIVAAALISAGAAAAQGGLNAWGASKAADAEKAAAEKKAQAIREGLQKGEASYEDLIKELETYKAGLTNYATPEMKAEYQKLISGYNPEDYVYDFKSFDEAGGFDKTVEDYLNPYVDEIVSRAGTDVLHKYGKTGMGDSGFEQMAAFRSEADKMNELYKEARADYTSDRDFAYKEYTDYITNMQNKLDKMASATGTQINLLSGAIAHDEKQESDYWADYMQAMTGKANLSTNLAMFS